jgi:hypothetical protein
MNGTLFNAQGKDHFSNHIFKLGRYHNRIDLVKSFKSACKPMLIEILPSVSSSKDLSSFVAQEWMRCGENE